jgi:hypothetical protein
MINIFSIGERYCLHNPDTGLLVLANSSAKLIAEMANLGKNEDGISNAIAKQFGEKVETISPMVRDALSLFLDEGGDDIVDSRNLTTGKLQIEHRLTPFQKDYKLSNKRNLKLKIECEDIFEVICDLLEPYEGDYLKADAVNGYNHNHNHNQNHNHNGSGGGHEIICVGEGDFQTMSVDGELVAYDVSKAFVKRLILEKFLCLSLLPETPSAILHAAAVIMNEKTVVIAGSSGKGKSTLSAYLTTQGARIVSDDLMCLSQDGFRVSTFRSKSNLKEGSWEILEHYVDDLGSAPTRLVQNISRNFQTKLVTMASPEPLKTWQNVDMVLHVDWQKESECVIRQLSEDEHFEGLFMSGTTIRKSDHMNPEAMVTFARKIPAYSFQYSNLPDARQQIFQLLEGLS